MDTLVSITAGMIIFPACFTYGQEVTAGPALLYNTMTAIFNDMPDGQAWGALFFLFMNFASFSTVLSVFETTLASVRELTGWGRPKGCLVCGGLVFLLALTTALGYNVWSGFAPFGEGTTFLNLWDFLVATNLMPIGSFVTAWFCCSRAGWGWDGFTEEANAEKGLKVHNWMRPMFGVFSPAVVMFLYVWFRCQKPASNLLPRSMGIFFLNKAPDLRHFHGNLIENRLLPAAFFRQMPDFGRTSPLGVFDCLSACGYYTPPQPAHRSSQSGSAPGTDCDLLCICGARQRERLPLRSSSG
jgi:hypothetical protein